MYDKSDKDVIEFRNTALHNKKNIKYKSVILNVGGNNLLLKIMGIGKSTVRLDAYLSYEDILNNSSGSLEKQLIEMINQFYD